MGRLDRPHPPRLCFAFLPDRIPVAIRSARPSGLVSLVVVRREEAVLEQRFGRAYLDYKHRVRRYVFIR